VLQQVSRYLLKRGSAKKSIVFPASKAQRTNLAEGLA
jgi:hypothetical protein